MQKILMATLKYQTFSTALRESFSKEGESIHTSRAPILPSWLKSVSRVNMACKTADIWHGNQSAASGVTKCRLFSRSTVNRRHVKAVGWFPICSNQFPFFPCLSLSWFSKVRFLKRPYMYLCLLRLFPVSLAPVKGQGVTLGTRTPICLIDSN